MGPPASSGQRYCPVFSEPAPAAVSPSCVSWAVLHPTGTCFPGRGRRGSTPTWPSHAHWRARSTPSSSAADTGPERSVAAQDSTVRYLVNKHSGKCLTVYRASGADNANVNQYQCVGARNQQWRMVMTGGDGALASVVLQNIGSGRCLTVHGASGANGANIDQYTCVGATNQSFALIPGRLSRTPLYTKPLTRKKCVDVQGANKANNANVIQWSCNGNTNQLWDMTRSA
ncbi:RICIN domain-containing protein [Streptomyces anthocyanicus]|uniref:RICIN domain-containing protein n=1 Tax=Streptomyces anthocyanicus TaxID=68174 RepID=UPI0037FB8227